MTIKVTITCDARACFNESEFYDMPSDGDIENIGWHTHPDCAEDHYCSACWPVVKKEIEEIRGEEI